MEGVGFVGSVWKLRISLNSSYTMIPKCFGVPRPVGTGSGNNPVHGVYKSVASVMVSVVTAMN